MAEISAPSYLHIDPTDFDLVVSGTGLPESLIAAAATAAGKTVLHLDANSFYGSHFACLSPDSLSSFLLSDVSSSVGDLPRRRLYSEIEIAGSAPEPHGSFSLDLAGPRVLYCADPAVDLMIRSGASHHLEFRSVEGTLLYWEGRVFPVPDSRQAIFKDRGLGLAEKSQMMRFMKLVGAHIGVGDGEPAARISQEELEMPFVDFLRNQRLPSKIRTIILYAIILADWDQDDVDACKKLIKTKEGIESLALYNSSVGRFPNAVGAFIYPSYGQGELPQAFCRCAAVNGALYVLRMPVVSLLFDEESGHYKGLRLASGQDIFSRQLVLDPSFTVPSSVSHPTNFISKGSNASQISGKVARGVCITNGSIQGGLSNILVVFPPKSLSSEQSSSVRALQLSSNTSVCPSEMFVVYLSAPCDDGILGKKVIHAAINALFTPSDLSSSKDSMPTSKNNEGFESESKPVLIWSCLYVQELTQATADRICSCPMPDGNLDYRNILESTRKLFTHMYPKEEYFPKTATPPNVDEDNE